MELRHYHYYRELAPAMQRVRLQMDWDSSVRREVLARLGWSLGGFRLVLQSSLFFCRDRGAAPLNIERLLDPGPIWSRQFQDLGLSSS